MKMKRIGILCLIAVLLLTACGKTEAPSNTQEPAKNESRQKQKIQIRYLLTHYKVIRATRSIP